MVEAATAEAATAEAAATSYPTGHVVLCGLDHLGFRTLEELRRLGEQVAVIVGSPTEELASAAEALGAVLVAGSPRDQSALRAAGIESAAAFVATLADDVGNLHAALTALDLNPRLRVVLRMFNQAFGQRVQSLVPDCAVLSASAIAAPSFVSAALHRDREQRIEAAGRLLIVRFTSSDDVDVLATLADAPEQGPPTLFPHVGTRVLSLVDGGPAAYPSESSGKSGRSPRRLGETLADLGRAVAVIPSAMGRKLWYLLAVLFLLASCSTLVFSLFADLALVDAIYFTVTIITTTGFGDINLRDAPAGLKIYGAALMLVGAAALAIFYALITDAIVSARLARALGGAPPLRDHIIVCGLGNIGYRVVEQLRALGVPVAAAELNESSRFVPAARRLGAHVLIADVRLEETLHALGAADARAAIVATDDDLANLEAALNARAINPSLRVVLRVFDPDLALRVERAFDIHISRSLSALAAPAFAAAAVGRRVVATVPVGFGVLIVGEARVQPGSPLAGVSIGELESRAECRVLMRDDGADRIWRPDRATALSADDELLLVTTRHGFAKVYALTEPAEAFT